MTQQTIPAYENPVRLDEVERAVKRLGLARWQARLLDCFPREEYVPVPAYARFMSSMWRHATWEHFVTDTLHSNGTQMATLLSMAYKPRVIVEMGMDAGFTTLQFCKLNPDAVVYGVDINSRKSGCDIPIAFHAQMNNVKNLNLILGRPSWEFSLPGKVDLCFIDADHEGDAPYKDTLRAWDNRNTSGHWCIAWDDYHENNPDVKRAVDRFTSQVCMGLQKVGSWFYIGTIPSCELTQYGMQ